MNIVVLAGGISTERAVSISTGTMVCKALRECGHNAILLDVFFGLRDADAESVFENVYDADKEREKIESKNELVEQTRKERAEFLGENVLKLCKEADIVFMALHGEDGENGKLQACFDLLGIRYTGSTYLGSALAMDKNLSKQLFALGNIPTPLGVTINRKDKIRPVSQYGLEYPLVVKPCCGGSSIGVFIVHNDEEYRKSLEEAFFYEEEAIVESFIEGREFSVGVVGNEAYPVIEIAPKEGFYSYENKYEAGRTIETCPADISKELARKMQICAVKACKVLKLEAYARVDFLVDNEDEIFCLEANTLPGMTPTSLLPQEAAANGLSFPELCEKLIEESMKKYNN